MNNQYQIKVLFLSANPSTMSLFPPTVALFYSILKSNGIDMRYFDTTEYDTSNDFNDPHRFHENNLVVESVDEKRIKNITKRYGDLLTDFKNQVEEWRPDIIMASVLESTFLFTIDILKQVRQLGIPHVLGGVFTTFAPETALSYSEVDIVCRGEGEKIIVPLCQKLVAEESLDNVPNLSFKDKNGIIINTSMTSLVDMNDNPSFDASAFSENCFYRAMGGTMYKMYPVETHRGCVHKCAFCNSPMQSKFYKSEVGDVYFRKKKIKNVMKDVEYFSKECGAEYLHFWADDFFLYSKKEIDEFCEAYKVIKLPFYVQTHPNNIDEYKVQKLVAVGLDRIGIGVEHGNEKFRREVLNRNYSNSSAIEGINILHKYGIMVSCNNILGFPDETPELHMDTVELNRKLNPDYASASIFTPFVGTPLRELAIQKGYLEKDVIAPTNSERSILEMPNFTKDEISGKSRTFNLYLKFPKNKWNEIKLAEELSPEGNQIWNDLKEEYSDRYCS